LVPTSALLALLGHHSSQNPKQLVGPEENSPGGFLPKLGILAPMPPNKLQEVESVILI